MQPSERVNLADGVEGGLEAEVIDDDGFEAGELLGEIEPRELVELRADCALVREQSTRVDEREA